MLENNTIFRMHIETITPSLCSVFLLLLLEYERRGHFSIALTLTYHSLPTSKHNSILLLLCHLLSLETQFHSYLDNVRS